MKTYTVKLDIGSVTSVKADGYECGSYAVKFYRGSPDNIVATYARSMIKEIKEIECSSKSDEIECEGSIYLQGFAL